MSDEISTPTAGLSMKRNFVWVTTGYVIYMGCQWGFLAVLAKWVGAVAVGQFGLALAICAPLFLFSNLALREARAVDIEGDYPFSHYFALRLVTALASVLAVVAILLVLQLNLETSLIVAAVAVAKAIEAQSDIVYGHFQYRQRMDFVARSLILRGSLALIAFTLAVDATGSTVVGLLFQIVVWLLILVAYDLTKCFKVVRDQAADPGTVGANKIEGTWSDILPKFDKGALLKLGWITLPIGVAGGVFSLQQMVPRYFIEYYLGPEQLGYFTAIVYIFLAGMMLLNSVGRTALTELSRRYANQQGRSYLLLLVKLAVFGSLAGLCGMAVAAVFGRELLDILYMPEYAAYQAAFVIIMAAGTLHYTASMLQIGILAARRFRLILGLNVVNLIAVLAVSPMLIPAYGVTGAAWAVLAVGVVSLVVAVAMVVACWLNIGSTAADDTPGSPAAVKEKTW